MCMLTAYVGDRPIAPLMLRATQLQEPFGGAHATGMAVIDGGSIRIEKDFGHISRVMSTTEIETLKGTTGIAHTRYSGKLMRDPRHNTKEKAHPYIDDTGKIVLMHNGDFNNYQELWDELKSSHTFRSYSEDVDDITDSEVTVHMLSDRLAEGMTMEEGLRNIARRLNGTFLLCVITVDQPETVWIANWHQRCVVGVGEDEAMFCSSHIGFHEVEDGFRIFEPPKNSIIKLTRGKVEISPMDPERVVPNLEVDKCELGGRILDMLKKGTELDYKVMERALNKDGMAQALGIGQERYREYMREGVSIVNPLIQTLEMLLRKGYIEERIDMRAEGGVEDTPRYSYSLA